MQHVARLPLVALALAVSPWTLPRPAVAQTTPLHLEVEVGARAAARPFAVRLYGVRYCGSTIEFYRPRLSANRLLVSGSWVNFAPCSSADDFDQTVLADALPAGTYTLVAGLCDFPQLDLESCPEMVKVPLVIPPAGEMRLVGGRFRVTLTFDRPGSATQAAAATQLGENAGDFTFFDPSNVEVTVKVLNGLLVNDRFWVFAASMTNLGFTLTVEDLAHCTGDVGGPCATRTYRQAPNTNHNFLDTEAFTN